VFAFSNAARLERECHLIIRCVFDDQSNASNVPPPHEARENSVEPNGASVLKLDFSFRKDLTPPSRETKSCIGLFSLEDVWCAGDMHLMLMNDGRVITPISYMTPLIPEMDHIPTWMVPVAAPSFFEIHRRVAENIQLVECDGTSSRGGVIQLSGSMWDGQQAVLRCISDDAEAADDMKRWTNHMKCVQKKMLTNRRTPLPISARASALHGRIQQSGSGQPVKVCLTGEGLLFWERMKLWAGSVAVAEGSMCIRLSSVFSNDILESIPFHVTFSSEQQRNDSLLMFQRVIKSMNDDMCWAESVMNVVNKTIRASSEERDREYDALVRKRAAVGDIPRYLCDLWKTETHKLLSAIFFCLHDSFSDSIFDFPASFTPPVVALLTEAFKQLHAKHGEQFKDGLPLSFSQILKFANMSSRVNDTDEDGEYESPFDKVSCRAWFWVLSVVAEVDSAALITTDDQGETFVYNLIFGDKRCVWSCSGDGDAHG
jgi:hypothetical protein